MEHREIIKRLAGNEALIQGLVSGLDETQSCWRPEPGKWSVLEVINHLYDEEREDFRHRLDLTLHTPDAAWTPNDPERWVSERKYNERDLKNSLENLISERRKSIAWLNALESPEWNSAYEHPVFGSIAAGDILCAWLAHAYFHARQISNLFIESFLDRLCLRLVVCLIWIQYFSLNTINLAGVLLNSESAVLF